MYSELNRNLPAHILPTGIQPFQELGMTKHSIYSNSLQHSSLSNTHHSLDWSVGDSFCAMWYKALIAFILNKGGFLSATHKRKQFLYREIVSCFRSFLVYIPWKRKPHQQNHYCLNTEPQTNPTLQSDRYVGMCPVPLQKMKALWRSNALSSQAFKLRGLS